MTDNVVKGRFSRPDEGVGDLEEQIEALMKRHGVTAFVVVAEQGKQLISLASFHGATGEDDQRAQFVLSAVCAHKSQEIREIALGLYNEDES